MPKMTQAEKARLARRDAIAQIIYPQYSVTRATGDVRVGPAYWADDAQEKAEAILALLDENEPVATPGTREPILAAD